MNIIKATLLILTLISCVGAPGTNKKKTKLKFEDKETSLKNEETNNISNTQNTNNFPTPVPQDPSFPNTPSISDKEQENNSIEKYALTVHKVVTKRCSLCHGENKIRPPFFATKDAKQSRATVLSTGKIDKENPKSSRFYKRLLNDKHNCWSDCSQNASEMLIAINEWLKIENIKRSPSSATGANTKTGSRTGKSFTTGRLTFDSAIDTIPITEDGTLVFHAEEGSHIGRMTVKNDSKAIGHKYITRLSIPSHPDQEGSRRGNNISKCSTDLTRSLQNYTNGPFRIQENKRHVNQDGPTPYSVMISAYLIRPDKLNVYYQMLRTNNFSNIEDIIIKNGNPVYKEGSNEILRFQGDPISVDLYRILPRFVKHNQYYSYNNKKQISAIKYLDQSLFRDNQGLYFAPEAREIRRNITDDDKRKIVFKAYRDTLKKLFFYSNGTSSRSLKNRIPWARLTNYKAAMKATYYNAAGSGDIDGIDRLIHYNVDPFSRSLRNFEVKRYNISNKQLTAEKEVYPISRTGSHTMDLSKVYVGKKQGVKFDELSKTAYQETLYSYFKNDNMTCINCHGTGDMSRGIPQYIHPNPETAWTSAKNRKIVNFDFPQNSKIIQKMNSNHNCGNACVSYKNEILSAIVKWKKEEDNINSQIKSGNSSAHKLFTLDERTPARSVYKFKVKQSGRYNVWVKSISPRNNRSIFYINIKNRYNQPLTPTIANKPTKSSCYQYRPGDSNTWEWNTPGQDVDSKRVYWNLNANETYSLEFFEGSGSLKVDVIAISKNKEFDPSDNVIDEGHISSTKPRVLKFDIQGAIGIPSSFEIEVKDKNAESYLFSNPRFISPNKNIKVKALKLNINNSHEFSNATYNDINMISGDTNILTKSSLFALKVAGKARDFFSFKFDILEGSNLSKTPKTTDVPKPFLGRKCKNVQLFAKTVKPIFSKFSLALKEDIDRYVDHFPGSNSGNGVSLNTYSCTSCHSGTHIYFKMRNYMQESDEAFCAQALSRVDFENPRRSLILRGLNGTHTHPKLHFMHSTKLNSNKTDYSKTRIGSEEYFQKNWLGGNFKVYSSNEVRIGSNLSKDEQDELKSFIGTYKTIKYKTHQDPLNFETFEKIMTEGDLSIPPSMGKGKNLYNIVYPQDLMNLPAADRKKYKYTAGSKMQIYVDKNTNAPNYESVKGQYRDTVLRWINSEK